MANEKFSQLPTTPAANLSDIFAAVQGGTSVQETLGQVFTLMLANMILHNAGNPNGSVAGNVYQLCWDTTNNVLYICTTSGSTLTAVWTKAGSFTFPLGVTLGGTGLSATTINQILYSSANNIIAGLATANNATLITDSSGAPSFTASLTDGQIIIGSTGSPPAPGTLTAGPGISISNSPGAITISGTGSGIGWTEVTGTTQPMSADNGYVANNASLVTFTLPATAAFGTALNVIGKGSGLFTVEQNSGQQLIVGNLSTTAGVSGSISSTNQFDSIEFICTTADTVWTCLSGPQGIFTIV